ncbi:MAG: EamA family transporter [Flavobacteriales bacterium]|nr:EamA family transporter [Flavobacteriales bacterium]
MQDNQKRWIFLIFLSLIWGSSFILMKRGLESFTPIQVGALRVSIAATTLLVFGFKHLRIISKKNILQLFLAGLLGNFLPAFLFAIAQSQLDSGITGILNSLVPLFTVVIGIYIFRIKVKSIQVIGIVIGLVGTLILIMKGAEVNTDTNYYYALFVVAACVSYAFNSNLIKKYLYQEKAFSITVSAFSMFLIPSLIILFSTGFFTEYTFQPQQNTSLMYIAILAIVGTAISVAIFNQLIKISSPVFATSVTYLIPIVAVTWAIVDGESLHWIQLLGTVIILSGVYLVNRR